MTNDHTRHQRKKVAIIGGGVGAITAAFALTEVPDWEQKYDITLYQLGFRLGGKGASGRNAAEGQRIEEHGLHVWAGFYHNALHYMKACYDGLNTAGLRNPDAPLGTMQKAFKPLNRFYLAEDVPGEGWAPLRVVFPRRSDDPLKATEFPTVFEMVRQLIEFMANAHDTLEADLGRDLGLNDIAPPQHHLAHLNRRGAGGEHESPLHRFNSFASALSPHAHRHSEADWGVMRDLAQKSQQSVRGMTPDALGSVATSDWRRNLYVMLDLASAFLLGMIENRRAFTDGFDILDDVECSQWFLNYGASQTSVDSAVLRGCYDYVFGYPGGVISDREVGAGTALRGLLRLAFTYRGDLFFEMQAGMGDTIFAPYYQILKHRGVDFKFFHAATALRLNEDKSEIERIEMVKQAEVLGPEYLPLVDVKDLPCWPSKPDWSQLKDGAKLKAAGTDFESEKNVPTGTPLTLLKGVDFDEVILGASLGSMHYIAEDLIAASSRWANMVEHVGTVGTQALQLWLTKPTKELGWPELVKKHNPNTDGDDHTIMTAFAEPLDTWADMSHLLPVENWGAEARVEGFAEPFDAWTGKNPAPQNMSEDGPKAIAYFCSPGPDGGTEAAVNFHADVEKWLNEDMVQIWPKTKKGKGFDYSLLYDPQNRTGKERLKAQFYRQNFYGSERYVLSKPNSVQHRMRPGEAGFQNLFLAGDWTLCGINAGCVEAATISGLAAARSLSKHPFEIVGEGDVAADRDVDAEAKLASPYPQAASWPLTPLFSVGRLDGWFSFHSLPIQEVQAMLPKGITLAPQAVTDGGHHPVTILNSHQMGVRPSFTPTLGPFGDYREAILAIPYVHVDGHEGTFCHLPTLYLDRELPIVTGRFFYALDKKRAKINEMGSSYDVLQPNGGPIWSARYASMSEARQAMTLDGLPAAKAIIEQPMVSVTRWGALHFSAFDFGLSAAYATPASACIEVGADNGLGLAKQTLNAPALGQETGSLPGAFRLWTSWSLSNPLDSTRVADLADARARLATG